VKIGDLVKVSLNAITSKRSNHRSKVGIIVDGSPTKRFPDAPAGWVLLASGETAWFDPNELEVIGARTTDIDIETCVTGSKPWYNRDKSSTSAGRRQ